MTSIDDGIRTFAPIVTGDGAIPERISQIPIQDFHDNIDDFREQGKLISRRGLKWPCVLVNLRNRYSWRNFEPEAFVPINLSSGRHRGAHWAMEDIPRAESVIRGYGLRIIHASYEEAKHAFLMGLSEVFLKRSHAIDLLSPPKATVTVTTRRNGQVVVYAMGYFISTQEGFGLSNPAQRSLAFGSYIFGVERGMGTQFSSTLWEIPEITEIPLNVEEGVPPPI